MSIDREADRVSITTARPNAIFIVAKTINELSLSEFRRPLDEATASQLLKALTSWRRPKPQKWGPGDAFSIPLKDGTFAYGQVLIKDYGAPTCALFELKTERPEKDLKKICRNRIITILHLGPELLDKGIWVVLGNQPISAAPDSGPDGKRDQVGSRSFSANALTGLAEAYYGLIPWNVYVDEKHFDKLLMKGLKRPRSAEILKHEERKKYRVEMGWEAP